MLSPAEIPLDDFQTMDDFLLTNTKLRKAIATPTPPSITPVSVLPTLLFLPILKEVPANDFEQRKNACAQTKEKRLEHVS